MTALIVVLCLATFLVGIGCLILAAAWMDRLRDEAENMWRRK